MVTAMTGIITAIKRNYYQLFVLAYLFLTLSILNVKVKVMVMDITTANSMSMATESTHVTISIKEELLHALLIGVFPSDLGSF